MKLEENEKLISVFRKHIFYFMARLSAIIFVAFLPLFFYLILSTIFPLQASSDSLSLFTFLYFLFLTVIWNMGFILWTDYYLDMWILTDTRLIDVEQKGLFSREVSSLRLDKIQDVKLEISGFIHTFMGIGSVHVQTAGSEKEFIIRGAKNPERIKEFILSAHNRKMEEIKTVRVESPADNIPQPLPQQ